MSKTASIEQIDRATLCSATLFTASQVKERGWTNSLIRDLLGPPDETKTNPHYRSGPPMRLYRLARVESAESSEAWADRAEATRRRKQGAVQALETKRAKLLQHLKAVEITLPILSMNEITQLACDHYNQRLYDRGDFESWNAVPSSDPAFLQRITVNYLRHCLSEYADELANIFGKVGVRDGYFEINIKAYSAIANAYPQLADECQRQLAVKFDSA